MSDQFEVLFYGFGGQSVLSEDKVFSVDESVYLAHRHVWQEVLERRRTTLVLIIIIFITLLQVLTSQVISFFTCFIHPAPFIHFYCVWPKKIKEKQL